MAEPNNNKRDSTDGQSGGTNTAGAVRCDLHICPTCGSDFVFPTDWEPSGSAHWRVSLRCPECEWIGEGVYAQDQLDEYDRILDLGTESLIDDLKVLTRSNMENEISAFARALEVNLIIPDDFVG